MTWWRSRNREHSSDHRTIDTVFDIAVPTTRPRERLLFKNALLKEINARIAHSLGHSTESSVQQKTDKLIEVVSAAVHTLTPKAKPSPYAKWWWTSNFTQLRRIYTYWRSRARVERRDGRSVPNKKLWRLDTDLPACFVRSFFATFAPCTQHCMCLWRRNL